ncbi:MAG: orotate phosphoribosyltransferase [Sulfurospirillum sp.]|nr:orotate phosphoribosyltransferase [Sulfurospirillum sp.]MBL0703603.1 orotate phosphoribosyltransferase [Sulfurospirillum sp.]
MNLEKIYIDSKAYLKGHFLLSSGKHSEYYLQSAKVLENPKTAELLAFNLAKMIKKSGIHVETVCSPALGGLLAGYELARSLGVRFIFAERVKNIMTIKRGFEIKKNEKILMCEDIITTGGSVLEAASQVEKQGGKIVAFAALANRGFCKREGGNNEINHTCKLPKNIPFFALGDFEFDVYDKENCPLCLNGSKAFKHGSREN